MAAEQFDLAELKIEDSNLAGIGSDEDKAVRKKAALSEPAWKGCGLAPGVEIWHVEQFKVVPWPREEYGNFYEGDSYIVLHTLQGQDKETLVREIYFWLGLESTADEQGTAAYKTVELDDLFDGQCIQHREVQMYESPQFKAVFKTMKKSVRYLKGGVASGFRHIGDEGAYASRLLIAKRIDGVVNIVQVPVSSDSLNHGDCFILDAGAKIYTWFGKHSSPFEKQAANTYAQNLENERAGKAKAEAAEGKESIEAFWSLLGGKGAIKEAADVPVLPVAAPRGEGLLMKLSDATGDLKCDQVAQGDLKKSMLQSDSVYICDPGNSLMVWVGSKASETEHRNAMLTATKYLRFQSRPLTTPVCAVNEGMPFCSPFNAIFAN